MPTATEALATVFEVTITGDNAEGFNVAGALAKLLDRHPVATHHGWWVTHRGKPREIRVNEIGPFVQQITIVDGDAQKLLDDSIEQFSLIDDLMEPTA